MRTTLHTLRGEFQTTLEIDEDRIWFQYAPFAMKDEIKALEGYRWHGNDRDNPRKVWSAANTPGNAFRIRAMMGEDVYSPWETPLQELPDLGLPLQPHQADMASRILTHHYVILGAEQGLGKSLSALAAALAAKPKSVWYVGPLSALESFKLEIKKWGIHPDVVTRFFTDRALTQLVQYDFDKIEPPQMLILDESSIYKNSTNKRSIAAKAVADLVRERYGANGYVVELSGTPCAKNPGELWWQAEIAYPGFIREGNKWAFDERYAMKVEQVDKAGCTFQKVAGWKESEAQQLSKRLEGLFTVYRKEDWLDLPPKEFVVERVQPTKRILRIAKSLAEVAPNTITALTWLRSLSSGFQYSLKADGKTACDLCDATGIYNNPEPAKCPACDGKMFVENYVRKTVQTRVPKDDVLEKWLKKSEDCERMVVACSFQGSIDKAVAVCHAQGWDTVIIDGRGWRVVDKDGNNVRDVPPLEYWEFSPRKVVVVGNPESCGFGLTLTKAWVCFFYDNSFRTEKRLQMMDRIHRMGMDTSRRATIVDVIHLPVDELILNALDKDQRLEALALGLITDCIKIEEGADE